MKYLLPLFLCLRCFAQLPVIPATGTGTPSTTFDLLTITNLFIELLGYDSRSLTNYGNGNIITNWIDLSGQGNNFTNSSGTHNPLYQAIATPANQPASQVSDTAGLLGEWLNCINNLGTNQPTTVFIVEKWSGNLNGWFNNLQFFFDSTAGAREAYVHNENVGQADVYAGTITTPPNDTNKNWMVWSFVYDGANSYVSTNWGASTAGGIYWGGNPGANGIGKMVLGTDTTFAEGFDGLIEAFLVAGSRLSTNYIHQVEQQLRTNCGF